MTDKKNDPNKPEDGVVLLDHEYDGIQEYDQRLPNWWLFTLYGAIVFSVAYWFFHFQSNVAESDAEKLAGKLERIEEENLREALAMLDDEKLWQMSQDPAFVAGGEKTYQSNCYTCHGAELEGGIGFNLADNEWVHGSRPTDLYDVVMNGVQGTSMQAWGSHYGPKGVAEVVAYVLSFHEREDLTIQSDDDLSAEPGSPAAEEMKEGIGLGPDA